MYALSSSTFESFTDVPHRPALLLVVGGGALVWVHWGFCAPATYWQAEVVVDFTSPL